MIGMGGGGQHGDHKTEPPKVEVDDWTRAGHERFKSTVVLDCGDGKPRTMNQWLAWMKTWNPLQGLDDNAVALKAMQYSIPRSPGISKRPR